MSGNSVSSAAVRRDAAEVLRRRLPGRRGRCGGEPAHGLVRGAIAGIQELHDQLPDPIERAATGWIMAKLSNLITVDQPLAGVWSA